MKVNKIDAARRQIDAAIRMLFEGEDPVAIHTLAMAGFRILRDWAAKRPDSYTQRITQSVIRPGMENKFWGCLQSFANFLKHADKDADATSGDVDEEINDAVLFIACLYYQDLVKQLTPEMMALFAWYTAIHPEFISEDATGAFRHAFATAGSSLRDKPRHDQLAAGKQALQLARIFLKPKQ